jgi:ABC-type uncharacterized transport system substrate-binding protein
MGTRGPAAANETRSLKRLEKFKEIFMRPFLESFGCLFTAITLLMALPQNSQAEQGKKFKVLHVDSYHEGYPWGDGITNAVRRVLGSNADIELKVHHMDTKRNPDKAFKTQAGAEAMKVVDEFSPDLVIAADDNAQEFLVVPYLRNTDIPVVFCGINWSADQYKYKSTNVTGIIEINAVDELLDLATMFANGAKVAFLAGDTHSERRESKIIEDQLNIEFVDGAFVSTFAEWKEKYVELQEKADILYLNNAFGITDFDEEEGAAFALDNLKIVTCSTHLFMGPLVMVVYAKMAEEQGEWAADTALKILSGSVPRDIPVARNQRAKILFNAQIIEKLGIKVPPDLLEIAETIQ